MGVDLMPADLNINSAGLLATSPEVASGLPSLVDLIITRLTVAFNKVLMI